MSVALKNMPDEAVLQEFLAGWAEVVTIIGRVKAASRGGAFIQYPKMPSSVSEALAARLLVKGNIFARATRITRGGAADLVVEEPDAIYHVEVKGSGKAEFQTFGRKNYACDLLVWMRFGAATSFEPGGQVHATLFPTPLKCLGDLGNRVRYATAEAAVRPGFNLRRLSFPLAELMTM